MSFTTAWSTNAVAVCHACGLEKIRRIERSRRYALRARSPLSEEQETAFLARVHDRMTECPYREPLESFAVGVEPEGVSEIPVLEEGRGALERINREMGLAFDDWDLDYYTSLFRRKTSAAIPPTSSASTSPSRTASIPGTGSSRDGSSSKAKRIPKHLIAVIQETLDANPSNSVIAFNDNSSAIRGYGIPTILPERPGAAFALRRVGGGLSCPLHG